MSRTLNEKQRDFLLEQTDIISPCHLFRHLQRTDVEVSDVQKELLNLQIPYAVKRFYHGGVFQPIEGWFFL